MSASNLFWSQDARLFQSPDTLETKQAHSRSLVLFLFLGILFSMVLGKITQLMVLHSAEQERNASLLPTTLIGRGNITDRNGNILATSLITGSAYANPQDILNAEEAARKLSTLFPTLQYEELYQKLTGSKTFTWIKRNLTPQQQQAINQLGIPGIYFQREEKRIYPYDKLSAHVVGFTDVDNNGISGVEKYFDEALRENGSNIELALDIRAQHILYDEMLQGMQKFSAKAASGIILDATNGEIIAMVSLPDFDPNQPHKSDNNSIFNTNTLGIYEMGSVFKIFTLAMALDAGKINLNSGYDTAKEFKVGGHKIKDLYPKNRWLSVPEIFMYSSNIGSVKMALEVGPEKQREFLDKMGLLAPSTLELPEMGKPQAPGRWGDVSAATISYGYGVAVSPLQMVNGVAAIINGGILRKSTLLVNGNKEAAEKKVISAATSEKMRRLLHLSVKEGTGKKGDADGYLVGGKTGTANKTSGKGYVKQNHHRSLFVGAFPMLEPRYVILVMLDEPKGTKETFGFSTGGWTSAPIAGNVIKRIAPIVGVLPVNEKSAPIQSAMRINVSQGTKSVT
jgi:cell division protein FtsI (penicillin-binding protein 3)